MNQSTYSSETKLSDNAKCYGEDVETELYIAGAVKGNNNFEKQFGGILKKKLTYNQ